MSLTPSTMLPLGTTAPKFSLPNLEQEEISLNDFSSAQSYVIAFICPHCPYVKHIEERFASLAAKYQQKGIIFIAINSNDPHQSPQDDIAGMKRQATANNFTFPYLIDHNQEVAHAYQAACTPDLFVFDQNKKLVYRGQFDESRPGRGQATGQDLKSALEALLNDQPLPEEQQPSSGCNIKWAPGNEPSY